MKNVDFFRGMLAFFCRRRALKRLANSDCASTTPEYAILTFAVIAILVLSIGSIGYRTSGLLGTFSGNDSHDRQDIARSPDRSMSSESFDLAGPAEWMSPQSQWVMWPQLFAVSMTGMWLLMRRKSTKTPLKPRPLEGVSEEAESERMFDKRHQILKVISRNRDTFLQGDLEVWHLATRNPATIALNQSVETARAMMEEHNVDHLLVCEADSTLVGLISKHYLKRTHFKRIADAMVTQPLFVAPNAMLNPTVTHMLNEGVSCVAVVEKGKAVGTLTTTDIQLTLQAALQILAKTANEERAA